MKTLTIMGALTSNRVLAIGITHENTQQPKTWKIDKILNLFMIKSTIYTNSIERQKVLLANQQLVRRHWLLIIFGEYRRVSLLLYFPALTKESSGGKQPPFSINWF